MKLQQLSKRDTKGWRIGYRYTPSDRRRTYFTAPDGTEWQQTTRQHATHYRKIGIPGLSPKLYLRRAA